MDLALTALLRCPACAGSLKPHAFESSDGLCETGVVVCARCSAWHPVSEFVLDLLPPERAAAGARTAFFDRHRPRLEALGLAPAPAPGAEPDPAFAAQAHQREHFDDLARRQDEFSYEALGRQPFQIALRTRTVREWRRLLAPGPWFSTSAAPTDPHFRHRRPADHRARFDISTASVLRAARRARSEDSRTSASSSPTPTRSRSRMKSSISCSVTESLHHVLDPARTLAEAARVLAPGGRYLGLENNSTPLRPIFDLLMRLRPLWREEAGAEAHIGRARLRSWTQGSRLELSGTPTVFVPPHLCNRLGVARARRLLARPIRPFGGCPRSGTGAG